MFHASIPLLMKNLILSVEAFFLGLSLKKNQINLLKYEILQIFLYFKIEKNDSPCAEKEIYLKVNKK